MSTSDKNSPVNIVLTDNGPTVQLHLEDQIIVLYKSDDKLVLTTNKELGQNVGDSIRKHHTVNILLPEHFLMSK